MAKQRADPSQVRWGIGEWYGRSFLKLTREERVYYSNLRSPESQACIPRSTDHHPVACTKKGGVCSIRQYQKNGETGQVTELLSQNSFATVCPHRFKEKRMIFEWVGSTIMGNSQPQIVTEIGFLIRERNLSIDPEQQKSIHESEMEFEDVGQIDYVLVDPDHAHLHWCALEIQAVYFSGPSMSNEFAAIREYPEPSIPFPNKNRRPDYRSSGPKRLMPQLQIKVPTLRRWGKKMAVVVDRGFYNALGKMDQVEDISNCDIVWFITDYQQVNGDLILAQGGRQFTTLERAVEGLTAGRPVSLPQFEHRIVAKVDRLSNP